MTILLDSKEQNRRNASLETGQGRIASRIAGVSILAHHSHLHRSTVVPILRSCFSRN